MELINQKNKLKIKELEDNLKYMFNVCISRRQLDGQV